MERQQGGSLVERQQGGPLLWRDNRNRKIDLPLFAELGQTSRDLVDIWSETQESWDVCPNSSKSGFSKFQNFQNSKFQNFKMLKRLDSKI